LSFQLRGRDAVAFGDVEDWQVKKKEDNRRSNGLKGLSFAFFLRKIDGANLSYHQFYNSSRILSESIENRSNFRKSGLVRVWF
jgi:hypothetical protein